MLPQAGYFPTLSLLLVELALVISVPPSGLYTLTIGEMQASESVQKGWSFTLGLIHTQTKETGTQEHRRQWKNTAEVVGRLSTTTPGIWVLSKFHQDFQRNTEAPSNEESKDISCSGLQN